MRQRRTSSRISDAFQSPHPRAGGLRIRLGQGVEQVEQHRIPVEGADDRGHGLRIVEVAAGRGVRQEQMVPHHRGEQRQIRRPQAHPPPDLQGQFGTDHAVVAAASLPDVVQQRAEDEQVRTGDPRRQFARVHGGLDEVPVDGPRVDGVAGRQVAHRTPFGEQPPPQSGAVQRLDDVDRATSRAEQHQEVVEGFPGPGFAQLRCVIGESGERGRRDGQSGLRSGRRDPRDQARIATRMRVACEGDLSPVLDDPFVERTPHRSAAQTRQTLARQRIGRGAQTDVDGIADRAGRFGEHPRKIETVADPQRRGDLVGVLRAQLVAGAAGDAVQLGAYIEQSPVGGREPAARDVGSESWHAVGELRNGQGIEQLHVPQPAATALEVGFGPVGDLPAALPSHLGRLDEFVEAGPDAGAPLPSHTTDEQIAQLGVARDVPRLEHSQRGRQIGREHLEGLGHRPDTVVELDVRVPQRVPELVGDLRHDGRRHVVVEEDEIEIGVREHLAASEAPDGDDGEASLALDAEFGALRRQPEFVQVHEGVAQGHGVEAAAAGAAGEQGVAGGRQIGGARRCGCAGRGHRRP